MYVIFTWDGDNIKLQICYEGTGSHKFVNPPKIRNTKFQKITCTHILDALETTVNNN